MANIVRQVSSNIKTVQKRLGHSRSATTEDRYIHLTEKMASAANIFYLFAQFI